MFEDENIRTREEAWFLRPTVGSCTRRFGRNNSIEEKSRTCRTDVPTRGYVCSGIRSLHAVLLLDLWRRERAARERQTQDHDSGRRPNRIGQGIEFDYCCVHAAFALRELEFETIMVNSNPETVSTDYDTSDKLYFEPLTLEDVLNIYEREKCRGAIAQFGGQTPLNLALG